jgi:ABC-type bacteriocin/lantibiotic exporter with double-glycine peptidase domain
VTILAVRPYGQPDGAQCGNTSLRMVLGFHNVHATIRECKRLAKTDDSGTEHANLIEAARKKGATVFAKNGGTLSELDYFVKRGLPPIIGRWSMEPSDLHFDPAWTLPQREAHDCGHFSVVSGITKSQVVVTDPQWEKVGRRWRIVGDVRLSKRAFLATWYDTDTPAYQLVDRWYMVLNFDGERFATRIGGTDYAPRG